MQKMLSCLRFFRAPSVWIMFFVVFLLTSGIVIYALNIPPSPSLQISEVSFRASENNRSIELYVVANRGNVELKQFFINNTAVYRWNAEKRVILEGENSKCLIEYPWRMGKTYSIKVVTIDGQLAEIITKAPEMTPYLRIDIKSLGTKLDRALRINVTCETYTNGTDSLHLMLFTYVSFEGMERPLYMFYDPRFMVNDSIKRADVIISHFKAYKISIEKVDYQALKKLSENMTEAVLIIINPLKERNGKRVDNVLPAPLIDPDKDGLIKDDSKYGKSLLYDLMKDKGLILITVGSLQPHKRIIYEDGVYSRAKDSLSTFDAHLFLTDATDEKSIINGSFVLGDLSPPRISGTLGLSYREASFGFDKNAMEKYGLQYYAYGDYKLPYGETRLNLTLPVFIRVGKGGWLAMGDGEFWLRDEELAHDLLMIYLQKIWDSKWVPYGWYWDNGCIFHSSYGVLAVNDSLVTEFIPLNVINDKLIIRVAGVAYSSETGKGVISEQILEYKRP